MIASDYIVDKVLTLVSARFRRQTAIRVGHVLFGQSLAVLIQLTDEDKERAWGIFRSHSDKGWSFTDCTSFALMQRIGISNARSPLIGTFRRCGESGACRTKVRTDLGHRWTPINPDTNSRASAATKKAQKA